MRAAHHFDEVLVHQLGQFMPVRRACHHGERGLVLWGVSTRVAEAAHVRCIRVPRAAWRKTSCVEKIDYRYSHVATCCFRRVVLADSVPLQLHFWHIICELAIRRLLAKRWPRRHNMGRVLLRTWTFWSDSLSRWRCYISHRPVELDPVTVRRRAHDKTRDEGLPAFLCVVTNYADGTVSCRTQGRRALQESPVNAPTGEY